MKVIFDKDKMNCPLKVFDGDGTVPMDDNTIEQAKRYCSLPFVAQASLMPDAHYGIGSTIGSVIATTKVIVPGMVGLDIGCGMSAVKTTIRADQLPDSLGHIRSAIEKAIPHGRSDDGGRNDVGGWKNKMPTEILDRWDQDLSDRFKKITDKHPKIERCNHVNHLGSLGTGNHFIEICLDLEDNVWFMLHSGSRGVGNRIGTYFINLAKEDMKRYFINIPDINLAYIPEGSQHFHDYIEALRWAQMYARINRELMMDSLMEAFFDSTGIPFNVTEFAVNCHHNYVEKERHFGKDVWVTRKGAVKAGKGDLGIIPGSMGARSFIVRGKGNKNSMQSCSHGAGRIMSRTEAQNTFSKKDLAEQTAGVECRKDSSVIDEIPGAYKPIELVMKAQEDLIEVVAELKQIVCVKG